MNMRWTIVVLLIFIAGNSSVWAQLPPFLNGGDSKTSGGREVNDQIEGTIWEFKGKIDKSNAKEGETPKLEGKFRLEEGAIFDISPTFKLPSKEEVKRVVEKVAAGSGPEIKLPSAPQQKRLGEFRKLSGGKYRLDFSAEDSLNGLMLIWKKRDTKDVWIGTFDERDGKKTVRKWDVELRPIED